jgi:intracellular multiplication protein IcmE
VVMGKLALAQGQDKVSLNFTLMNMDSWDKGKNVTAFAIDPDTARTVMASNVNYHYMLRYGTMFASSFVTGYANGISQSGSTTSSGIFGTTNTHPQLSPGEKIAVALGQVGTTFGTALANYVNTPTTVKVNSGVGLGILFMADVT